MNGPKTPRTSVTLDMDVYEAARQRVRWLFKEFDGKVCATGSGGKDSTVVMELAAEASMELGYGPLKVWWLDQEAEFEATVEYQKHLAYEREDIDFTWYQIPFRMEQSMNLDDPWFNVWGEGEEWLREKDPSSIKENTYGTDNFYKLLDTIRKKDFKGYVTLDGMRVEESPSRRVMALTRPQYKWVTWSSNAQQPRFQPIYDWSYRDVWHAMEINGWRYNKHYDHMFRYGVPTRNMRVSSFTHNQSLQTMIYLQEVEPKLWEAATRRFPGMATFGQLKSDQYVKELPYMFSSWEEYMHHLIDNLLPDEPSRETFRKQFKRLANAFPEDEREGCAHHTVSAIISGDHHGIGVNAMLLHARKGRNFSEQRA